MAPVSIESRAHRSSARSSAAGRAIDCQYRCPVHRSPARTWVTDARVPSASPRRAVAQTLHRQQRPERARCRVRPRAKVKHRPVQPRYLTEPLSAGGVHVGRAAGRCGPVPPGATLDTAFTYTGVSGAADTPRHSVRPHRGPPTPRGQAAPRSSSGGIARSRGRGGTERRSRP
jgi:hypothetical protein